MKLNIQFCNTMGNTSGARQSALHKENSGFAAPTLHRHISTFCGYRILFSIRNPYINRFTNHSLFSLWRALWRPRAPTSRTKSRQTAEESRTSFKCVPIIYGKSGQDTNTKLFWKVLYDIFLFIHNHRTLRKWCYTRVHHDFHISPCQFIFQPLNVISRY
jgi:hypothetical protein